MPDPTPKKSPIYVTDINDPRLIAYNDSLKLFNSTEYFKTIGEFNPDITKGNIGRYYSDYLPKKNYEKFTPIGTRAFKGENDGGKYLINEFPVYKKPVQSVEFVKDPPYNKIPTKTPTITSIQQAIDDELRTSFIEPAITYPKDVQRFTAGNYLESQGKPSGYVNYGEGEGRKELYENGGIVNNDQIQGKTIDTFYSPKKAKSMGSDRSYPYRTLENPSYEDININPPQYHDPNVIREMRIERRLTPSNIPNDSSFNQINNNDIGFLFNESFGI